MKRAICLAVAMALAACSPAPPRGEPAAADADDGWTRPPMIERVDHAGTGLVVRGLAQAGARVVLRGGDGAALAATADDRGRFEIRLETPSGHLLLRPETQIGQDAVSSPDRLLVLDAGRGPVVVLRPGGPSRRLDAAPTLGAIDSDGRMRLASGRAAPGVGAVEVQGGGETVRVVPDAAGRWSVMLGAGSGPAQVRVAGRAFEWPGEGAQTDGLAVERLPSGWRIGWSGPGGGRQSTWLPDAAG